MALADLAKFNLKEPVSLRDISLRQGISLVYLEQLFSKLKKNQIVTSVRGNKGGYVLSKQASEIKISDVFIAVDEKVKTVGCEKQSESGCNGKSSKCIFFSFSKFSKLIVSGLKSFINPDRFLNFLFLSRAAVVSKPNSPTLSKIIF